MGCCFVPNCSHRSDKDGCTLVSYPSAKSKASLRKRFKELTRREDRSPGKSGRICSCHFPGGDTSKEPSIFPLNKDKVMMFASPEKKRRISKGKAVPKRILFSPPEKEASSTQEETVNLSSAVNDVAERDHTKEDKIAREIKVQNLILTAELDALKSENEALKAKLKSARFSFDDIRDNDDLVAHFTGIPNAATFELLYSLFDSQELEYYLRWKVNSLPRKDQLLLTLMKLRRNLSITDLAVRFKVSKALVSNVFLTWLHALHTVIIEGFMAKIPSRFKKKASMPECFSDYKSCRIVLDCTEIFAENPKLMSKQNAMYSAYTHRITLKGLIGIAPNGTITFCSRLYPGSTSDKSVVSDSGIIESLERGDFVMADKGFLIGDILPEGVTLNIPPFKTTPQFTPSQVEATYSIAQARIHVERAIQRVKTYQILNLIPANKIQFASDIFQVC